MTPDRPSDPFEPRADPDRRGDQGVRLGVRGPIPADAPASSWLTCARAAPPRPPMHQHTWAVMVGPAFAVLRPLVGRESRRRRRRTTDAGARPGVQPHPVAPQGEHLSESSRTPRMQTEAHGSAYPKPRPSRTIAAAESCRACDALMLDVGRHTCGRWRLRTGASTGLIAQDSLGVRHFHGPPARRSRSLESDPPLAGTRRPSGAETHWYPGKHRAIVIIGSS